MKPRGDALKVEVRIHEWKYDEDLGRKTLYNTRLGTIWRRPLVTRDESIIIRFNYGLYRGHELDKGLCIYLNDDDHQKFTDDSGRYGGETYE